MAHGNAAATYGRLEAKEWAHERMKGVCDVIIPSYRSDLAGLNEAGIGHDARRNMELGFRRLADGLRRAEMAGSKEDLASFFVGRNPA